MSERLNTDYEEKGSNQKINQYLIVISVLHKNVGNSPLTGGKIIFIEFSRVLTAE